MLMSCGEIEANWSTEMACQYKPVLPIDGFGECGRSEAILGWRDGIRTDILDPRLSWLCINLLSRKSETFIKRGFGVLNIVRFSRQRALQNQIRTKSSVIIIKFWLRVKTITQFLSIAIYHLRFYKLWWNSQRIQVQSLRTIHSDCALPNKPNENFYRMICVCVNGRVWYQHAQHWLIRIIIYVCKAFRSKYVHSHFSTL